MLTIRLAAPADAEAIARVHAETWRATYINLLLEQGVDALPTDVQRERWEESLQQPKRTSTLVAEEGGEILGFASYGPEPGSDYHYQGELYAIYVLPAHQGHGIGTRLLGEAAAGLLQHHLPNMMLWVLSRNPSRQWCEKLGGRFLRERVVDFGGEKLNEAAYGWDDLAGLAQRATASDAGRAGADGPQ